MASVTISRELAWKEFERAVRREFSGVHNKEVRARIRRTALGGGSVGLLGRSIGFTAFGAAALLECTMAANRWQQIVLAEEGEDAFLDHEYA